VIRCWLLIAEHLVEFGLNESHNSLLSVVKDDNDWMKKCMEYEVEGPKPRGRQKGPEKRWCKYTVQHIS